MKNIASFLLCACAFTGSGQKLTIVLSDNPAKGGFKSMRVRKLSSRARWKASAQQMLTARLLEIDSQGVYHFSEGDRRSLLRNFIESVNSHGVSCYANDCANRNLVTLVSQERLSSRSGGITGFDKLEL
jgi:hypothetical protein